MIKNAIAQSTSTYLQTWTYGTYSSTLLLAGGAATHCSAWCADIRRIGRLSWSNRRQCATLATHAASAADRTSTMTTDWCVPRTLCTAARRFSDRHDPRHWRRRLHSSPADTERKSRTEKPLRCRYFRDGLCSVVVLYVLRIKADILSICHRNLNVAKN